MADPVSAIRNLGPRSEEMFARAGMTTADEVRALGAEAAYRKLLQSGTRPHFIGFYALWLGLQDRPWNDLHPDEKARLRVVFDDIVAGARHDTHGPSSAFERALDAVGVQVRGG